MNYYSQYKGIWYRYEYTDYELGYKEEYWILSDRQDEKGVRTFFNANIYRIDECFEIFFEENKDYLIKPIEEKLLKLLSPYTEEEGYKVFKSKGNHPNWNIWKEAFDYYNMHHPEKHLQMNCLICYDKVYDFLKI